MRRFLIILSLAAVIALLTSGVVLASEQQQLGGKVITGDTVTIASGDTVDHDLYVFAGRANIDGTVNGDLVAAGGNVNINGTVTGDVIVAGGQVTVGGKVGGHLRVAGGQAAVNGDVAKDVLAAGGQVTIPGKVGQDLIVWAGDLVLSGSVTGSTTGSAGNYDKSGSIGGSDGIVITGDRAQPIPIAPRNPVLDAIRQFVAVLLIAVLAMWLVPRAFAAAEERARVEPVPSFGWGIVAFVGYIVALIAIVVLGIILAIVFAALGFGGLLALDVFGAFVAFAGLTLAFILAAGFLADAVVGLALARAVGARTGWSTRYAATSTGQGRWADLGLLAAGVAVVVILTALPVIGGLFKLIVVLVGLGALWLAWRRVRMTPMMTAPGVATAEVPPTAVPPVEPMGPTT
jgi:hypothetical protein